MTSAYSSLIARLVNRFQSLAQYGATLWQALWDDQEPHSALDYDAYIRGNTPGETVDAD